jgi:Tol biopolymer transport system component
VLLNVPRLPPEAQFHAVTMTHFDAKGNLSWVEHTVINGTLLEPGWTPDGRELVYTSDLGGLRSLWRVSISGGTPQRVAGAVSPDGKSILYPQIEVAESSIMLLKNFR